MLNLKFEQVRAFLHVARGADNTSAANALHLSPPAITARVKNLQQVLGVDLFERDKNGRRLLSKRGEIMLSYAEQLEYLVTQIARDVAEPDGQQRLVRIGVAETIAQTWMSDLLFEFQQRHPDLQVEIQVDISSHLLQALNARKIDIALAIGPRSDNRIEKFALPPITLNWYTCAGNSVHDAEAAARMFGKPIVTYPKNTVQFRQMREAAWSHGGHQLRIIPCSSLSSSLKLVCAGFGVAALPAFLAEDMQRRGKIMTFDPGWCPDPLDFGIYCPTDSLDPVIESLVSISQRVAGKTHLPAMAAACKAH